MIFVTVGTHEQQFNRLVMYMDNWAASKDEEVIIQTGYCSYEPKNCQCQRFYSYHEISCLIEQARIIITHGGPSSFIAPLQRKKIPIVVPRQLQFDEHVNNHQLDFCRQIAERMGTIILVEEIEELGRHIEGYQETIKKMNSLDVHNNEKFCEQFASIVDKLMT